MVILLTEIKLLATTHVSEIYDEGYKAKRMEVSFVAGAVPKSWVRPEKNQQLEMW